MRDFRKFEVTALARGLAVHIYRLVKDYPQEERFAMCQQMRRAVTSIGANIAEGAGRHTEKDFAHFLTQAIGSACELEYLLILSEDLGYVTSETNSVTDEHIQHIKSKLYRFRQTVRGQ
jgi:four helix bundle protein